MVAHTKWNTQQVLSAGLLSRPVLQSRAPEGTKWTDVDELDTSDEKLQTGLQSGGLSASMSYGVWKIWRVGDTWSGELMQYRNVTDDFDSASLDEAFEKAREWIAACYG